MQGNKPKDVDAYIARAPIDVQRKLRQIRAAIREVAPEASERISYGMPYFSYKGRLAYFAYFKDHMSFFAMPPTPKNLADKVKKYMTGKSTLQFRLDVDLPIGLIKALVRERVKMNEKQHEKRK